MQDTEFFYPVQGQYDRVIRTMFHSRGVRYKSFSEKENAIPENNRFLNRQQGILEIFSVFFSPPP